MANAQLGFCLSLRNRPEKAAKLKKKQTESVEQNAKHKEWEIGEKRKCQLKDDNYIQ